MIETSLIKVLGFHFDSLLTWEPQISDVMGCARQQAGQLYCCRSLLTQDDMCTVHKSWICPTLEYGNILYSGTATTHLCHLHALQSRIEQTCSFIFQPLSHCQEAAIVRLVYRLLAAEGHGNLLTYCPQFCGDQTHRWSLCLHSWDSAGHLRFIDPCNFKTLDRLKYSWLATAPIIWSRLPADIIL